MTLDFAHGIRFTIMKAKYITGQSGSAGWWWLRPPFNEGLVDSVTSYSGGLDQDYVYHSHYPHRMEADAYR